MYNFQIFTKKEEIPRKEMNYRGLLVRSYPAVDTKFRFVIVCFEFTLSLSIIELSENENIIKYSQDS